MNTFQLVTAAARAAANWTIQRLLAHPLDKARPAVFLSSNMALLAVDSKWEAVTSVNEGGDGGALCWKAGSRYFEVGRAPPPIARVGKSA